MSWATLDVEDDGPVVRVWLNRPAKLNALSTTTLEELEALFSELNSNFEARVAVLGGRGRSFCAGADLAGPPGTERMFGADVSDRERRWASQLGLRALRAVETCEVITIARIHGHAVGGGFGLATACDLRVAADTAQLAIPEVDLGVPLTWGITPRLIGEIGAARARQLILLCDPIDAGRAETWGVVHRVVPEAELDQAVDDWARRLATKPEIAVHSTKTQFRAYAASSALGDVTETDGDILRASMKG